MRNTAGARRSPSSMGRRQFLRTLGATSVGAAGIVGLDPFKFARAAITPGQKAIYITALYRTKTTLNNYGFILRLETNKGITGYGECRDLDSGNQAGLDKYAYSKGVKTALHNSSGPVAMTAYAHLAAVVPGLEAMEYHHMDVPWHDDLVDGIDKPMITNGHMNVPEGPGFGITLNQSALSAHGASVWTRVV